MKTHSWELHGRLCSLKDEVAWLKLMAKVQAESDAWEALYLSHPAFDPPCDRVYSLENSSEAIGIIAGWKVAPRVYSIEIFALHPDWTGRGWGKRIINDAWESFEDCNEMIFWTSCDKAALYYKHLGLEFRQSKSYIQHAWEGDVEVMSQVHALSQTGEGKLMEYVLTSQRHDDIFR